MSKVIIIVVAFCVTLIISINSIIAIKNINEKIKMLEKELE